MFITTVHWITDALRFTYSLLPRAAKK